MAKPNGRLIILVALWFTNVVFGQNKDKHSNTLKDKSLERKVFKMIESGKFEDLWQQKTDRKALASQAAPGFSFTEDLLVWRIEGKANQVYSLEYLISNEDKAYEALLVVDDPGLARALRIAKASKLLIDQGATLRIQIAFVEDGKSVVRELHDLVSPEELSKVAEFTESTKVNLYGWEAFNMETIQHRFPQNGTPATLVISLQRK